MASTTFLAGETLRQAAGLELVHVPFKGVPEAVTAVLRGDVSFYFSPVPDATAQAEGGKARMLATTSPTRLKDVPDIPTIAESGVPSFKYGSWFGLMAPKGVPQAVVDKINADVREVLKMPDVREKLIELGFDPIGGGPAEYATLIAKETDKWAKVIKAAGVKLD